MFDMKTYMDAKEAKIIGLIDEIVKPPQSWSLHPYVTFQTLPHVHVLGELYNFFFFFLKISFE